MEVRKGAVWTDLDKVPVSLRLEGALSRKAFLVRVGWPRGTFSEMVRELVGGRAF